MANFCTKCGALNEDNVKFCFKCGNAFDRGEQIYQEDDERTVMASNSSPMPEQQPPMTAPVNNTKICGKCGSELDANAKFCFVCGESFIKPAPEAIPEINIPGNAVPVKKKSKAPAIIITVLAVLLVAIAALFAVAYFTDVEIPVVTDLVANFKNTDEDAENEDAEKETDETESDEKETEVDDVPGVESEKTTVEEETTEPANDPDAQTNLYYKISSNTPNHAGVNMREEADPSSALLTTLDEGTSVYLLGKTQGEYTYVEVGFSPVFQGWVMTKYLEEDKDNAQAVTTTPEIDSTATLAGDVLGASNVNATRKFYGNKCIDGDPETCWCVNTEGEGGAGAQIKILLKEKANVNGIKIINGNQYMPEDDIYNSNGQIKDFTLTFSDGSSFTFTADKDNGDAEWQTFNFKHPVTTDYIILTVDSGYIGASYATNVCLGEFDVF